jgi:hypothetical protein
LRPIRAVRTTPAHGQLEQRLVASSRSRCPHGAGVPPSLLQYLAQDDYALELAPQSHRLAVLENDVLRATVTLDLGSAVVAHRYAERSRAALRQSGRPAGQPRAAQRVVLGGVE